MLFSQTCGMEHSLDSLEHKVDRLLTLCAGLRKENETLNSRIAHLEADKAALTAKIDTARVRLEGLMEKLPEE